MAIPFNIAETYYVDKNHRNHVADPWSHGLGISLTGKSLKEDIMQLTPEVTWQIRSLIASQKKIFTAS